MTLRVLIPLLAGSLLASTATAEVSIRTSRVEKAGKRSVSYDFVARKLKDTAITFRLKRHAPVTWEAVPKGTAVECGSPEVDADWYVWTCRPTGDEGSGSFSLAGPTAEVSFGGGTLQVQHGTLNYATPVDGLTPAYDSHFVRAVFGGGVSVLRDDNVNFKTDNGALRVVNDSVLRTSGLFGALFKLTDVPWRGRERKEVSALVSMEFTQGTANLLDAFQFGLGWELSRYLTLVAGFSLRKGEELSHGFEQAASQVIGVQQTQGNAAYRRFPVLPQEVTGYDPKQLELLDGLLLNDPATAEPFFSGSPIVESYNRSWFVGFAIPVNLRALITPQ